MRGHRKGQSHVHTTAVTFHRCVEESFDFSERHNLVELGPNLGAGHPKDCTVQINVLASGELRMKAGADLEEAGHPPSDANPAFGWFRDPAQNLQQGGFTRAVPPDDTERVSLLDFKRDIFE